MKVINAYWEKRNLGVETKELICENADTIDEVKAKIKEVVAEYVVVKIPSERMDLSRHIQKMGFCYIEDLIEVVHDLHEPVRTPLHQRLYDSVSYRKMVDRDIQQLLRKSGKGFL